MLGSHFGLMAQYGLAKNRMHSDSGLRSHLHRHVMQASSRVRLYEVPSDHRHRHMLLTVPTWTQTRIKRHGHGQGWNPVPADRCCSMAPCSAASSAAGPAAEPISKLRRGERRGAPAAATKPPAAAPPTTTPAACANSSVCHSCSRQQARHHAARCMGMLCNLFGTASDECQSSKMDLATIKLLDVSNTTVCLQLKPVTRCVGLGIPR